MNYALTSIGETIAVLHESVPPVGTLLVVPCGETFLKKKSPGTVLHSQLQGKNSKFKGCHDVEKFLLKNALIRYEPREKLGRSLDPNESAELFGALADFDELSGDELFSFLLEGSRRELGPQDVHKLSYSAHDWQERLQRSAQGHEQGHVESGETVVTINAQEELSGHIEQLLDYLTTKQRNAVRAVYLDNYEGLSRVQIARRMGIREDSLAERLHGAFKKLRAVRSKKSKI